MPAHATDDQGCHQAPGALVLRLGSGRVVARDAGVGTEKTPVPIEVAAWALLFGGLFCAQWLVQCPKCWSRLGPLGASIGLRRTVRFCPYCGVNLDEPVPHKLIE